MTDRYKPGLWIPEKKQAAEALVALLGRTTRDLSIKTRPNGSMEIKLAGVLFSCSANKRDRTVLVMGGPKPSNGVIFHDGQWAIPEQSGDNAGQLTLKHVSLEEAALAVQQAARPETIFPDGSVPQKPSELVQTLGYQTFGIEDTGILPRIILSGGSEI